MTMVGTNGSWLCYYDGIDYKSYKHIINYSTSISSSQINCYYLENRNWIWAELGLYQNLMIAKRTGLKYLISNLKIKRVWLQYSFPWSRGCVWETLIQNATNTPLFGFIPSIPDISWVAVFFQFSPWSMAFEYNWLCWDRFLILPNPYYPQRRSRLWSLPCFLTHIWKFRP